MRSQRRADATNVDVALAGVIIVKPHHLLGDPAGDGERDFAVALASGRGLELSNTLLEVGAAVVCVQGALKALGFRRPLEPLLTPFLTHRGWA